MSMRGYKDDLSVRLFAKPNPMWHEPPSPGRRLGTAKAMIGKQLHRAAYVSISTHVLGQLNSSLILDCSVSVCFRRAQ